MTELKSTTLKSMHLAAFKQGHDACAAAKDCRQAGFEVLDIYGPYPIHGFDEALGIRSSRLTWACFAFGLTGFVFAMWLQYFSSETNWPINVGGKPFQSWPAFVPVAFEMTVLFAGLGVVATFFFRQQMFPGKKVKMPNEFVTDDQFVVVVEGHNQGLTQGNLDEIWTLHHASSQWNQMEEIAS